MLTKNINTASTVDKIDKKQVNTTSENENFPSENGRRDVNRFSYISISNHKDRRYIRAPVLKP